MTGKISDDRIDTLCDLVARTREEWLHPRDGEGPLGRYARLRKGVIDRLSEMSVMFPERAEDYFLDRWIAELREQIGAETYRL